MAAAISNISIPMLSESVAKPIPKTRKQPPGSNRMMAKISAAI